MSTCFKEKFMPLYTVVMLHAASLTGGIFSEGTPTGGEPYNLPPITALILSLILITILVLALAYNIRSYHPPEVSHQGVDTSGESLSEH